MLNPEGVICGNFRCSLTGTDLNRRWDSPDEVLHPQIYYLKNLMSKLISEKKSILVFCDLHGHSRKNGAFIYGCNKAANGGFCSWTKVRLLPRMIARKTHLFNYKECRFRIENDKQRTARVVVWKEFGVTNSFTLESSFYGYIRGDSIVSYEEKDYYSLGQALLSALLEYYYVVKDLEKEMKITKGWLKPSRLIELTGTPAADILAKELVKQKEELQRRSRMQKLQSSISAKKDRASIFSFILLKIIEWLSSKKPKAQKSPQKDNTPPKIRDSKTTPNIQRKKLQTPDEQKNNNEDSKIDVIKRKSVEGIKFIQIRTKSRTSTHKEKFEIDPIQNRSISSENNESPENQVKNDEISGISWREYFSPEEIEYAYNNLNKGIDPNDLDESQNKDESGSDSNPSEDNLEKSELKDFILSLPKEYLPQDVNYDEYYPKTPTNADEERKKVILTPTRQLLGNNIQRTSINQQSPPTSQWSVAKYDTPSIVITSKNSTKAASLVKDAKYAIGKTAPFASTYNKGLKSPFDTQMLDKKSISSNKIKHQQTFTSPPRPSTVTKQGIKRPSSREAAQISRTMCSQNFDRSRDAKSNSPFRPLPVISRVPTTDEENLQMNGTQPTGFMKSSANFRMMAEHTCAPTININIRSVNINGPAMADPYHSFHQNPRHASLQLHNQIPVNPVSVQPFQNVQRKPPFTGSNVLGSIPKHDETPAFQRIFGSAQGTKAEHSSNNKAYEYYLRQKKKARIGATLTELLVGGLVPTTLKDYVLQKRTDNSSFRFVPSDHRNVSPNKNKRKYDV